MGQMIMIDEKELNELKTKASWCDAYYYALDKVAEDLYPDYVVVDPVNGYQYNHIILYEMYLELKEKRKPWWKRLCGF